MLDIVNKSLKALENSFMLSYREVRDETNKLSNLLSKFENSHDQNELSKSLILNTAKTIEQLSIKNEYKLNLLKDFPEYFSNIRNRKK